MNKKHYKEVESDPNFSNIENKIITFWKENSLFNESVKIRDKNQAYVFYDGPPFANGLPHFGHLLTGFVKDSVARYQTMNGKKVERRFGWDCHGLPAELGAEKELGISGRKAIEDFGIEKFTQACKSSVMKYTGEWSNYVQRQARWVDFDNDYKTMDMSYMESVMWAFNELYKKGYIYESMRVMPYSWACETPLSNFETRLDNSYRERADKTVTVKFKLQTLPATLKEHGLDEVSVLAWTTTPWTLPSNLALAVNKDIDYAYFIRDNKCIILAESSIAQYKKELGDQQLSGTIKGLELIGCKYQPLFDYFKNHTNGFKILNADFVEEGEGTSIVHLAPGFGEDDQIICQENDIELVCPVDSRGCFTDEVSDYAGKNVFDTIDEIIIKLKQDNQWFKSSQYIHNYPHCWRTDTPLIYKAIPSWYVKVTEFKDRMVEHNKQINWIPGHIKEGLFGKWIKNAKDWSISRNRFWGTPIPIWKSDNPKYPRIDVYGSIQEIEQDFGIKVTSLHKPFIDNITRTNPDDPTGKSKMVRVKDVFDCWFDSGSMPYAQMHYPFENKQKFEQNFPADFIVEYTAQTRGWFYTLLVLSTAIFDKPPFLNCICHGVILDQNGQKLSKRLNNYTDPMILFEKYGADALRLLMLSSPVLSGSELLIDKEGEMIKDKLRLSIKPIWNAYKFFTLYANADSIKAEMSVNSDNLMDKYIISKTKYHVDLIKKSLDEYDFPSACKNIDEFIDILNNWYIRRNKVRFWKSKHDQDKQNAYNSLFTTLNYIIKAAAPILPLTTEEIYKGLNPELTSIHLESIPDTSKLTFNKQVVLNMDKVREICSAALAIRNTNNIRVRQPLEELIIYGDFDYLQDFEALIAEEVNVKKIKWLKLTPEIADKTVKINFPLLGKRLPTKMKHIISDVKQHKWNINTNGDILIQDEILHKEEASLVILPKENSNNSFVLANNDALIKLDLNISDTLKNEGIARDLVRFIQQSRKDANLDISTNINLVIKCDEKVSNLLTNFISYIEQQTLSNISFVQNVGNINNFSTIISSFEINISFQENN